MAKKKVGRISRIQGLIRKIFPKIITWEEVRVEILDAIKNEREKHGKEKDGSP